MSTGLYVSRFSFMTLAMDMPQVTDVMARNRIMEMTAMDIETVFTFAAS